MFQAFTLFERDRSGLCDARELGTVLRSLGINPTEAQLHSFREDMGALVYLTVYALNQSVTCFVCRIQSYAIS